MHKLLRECHRLATSWPRISEQKLFLPAALPAHEQASPQQSRLAKKLVDPARLLSSSLSLSLSLSVCERVRACVRRRARARACVCVFWILCAIPGIPETPAEEGRSGRRDRSRRSEPFCTRPGKKPRDPEGEPLHLPAPGTTRITFVSALKSCVRTAGVSARRPHIPGVPFSSAENMCVLRERRGFFFFLVRRVDKIDFLLPTYESSIVFFPTGPSLKGPLCLSLPVSVSLSLPLKLPVSNFKRS